jgi:hypothetical protein
LRDIRKVRKKRILDDCRDIVEMKAAAEVIRPDAQPGDYKKDQPDADGKQKILGLLFWRCNDPIIPVEDESLSG